MKRRSTLAIAWTLAFFFLALLLLKTFAADVYHVDSGSMAPLIYGSRENGERVLVVYDRSAPQRFDCSVLLRRGDSTPIVKRMCGLPGESVRVLHGDLLIDNARLAPNVPRPPPVAVFDDRWHSIEEHFQLGPPSAKRWTERDGTWEVDARDVPLNAQAGMMFLRNGLRDDHLAADHSIVHGDVEVNDAIVECEVRAIELPLQLRVVLSEQGDTFEFVLRPSAPDKALARIVRRYRSDADEVLAEREVDFVTGGWYRVRCSNVDNHLAFEIGDEPTRLTAAYDLNHLHHADIQQEGKSYGSRVFLGGEGGRIAFRKLRIWRDLYYTGRGQFGVRAPIELGPDEYFALGDNSAESRDSREWGPMHASEIVGRPAYVVWPFERMRKLRPTADAP